MSSLASLPEIVGFFSYSREDDEGFKGTLSALREGIQRELSAQLGRSKRNFRLWQDQEAIAPGKLWESEIKAAVSQAVFFIPIVTPRTAGSGYCQVEFEAFLARERALGRTDLIFPILYITVPGLDDETRWRGHGVLSVIGERQYVDWRHLRHLSSDTPVVREAIELFCQKIVEALNEPWLSPEERQAQAEREAQAEQERQEAAARQREQLAREAQTREAERREAEAREAQTRAADEEQRRQAEDARKAAAAEAERKAAAEAARQAEAQSKAKAEAEARRRAAADAGQKAEPERVAVAAAAENASPAGALQPARWALPQTSKPMIWALGGVLATALLIDPPLFHLTDSAYEPTPPGLIVGLIVGLINCLIAAGLVVWWERLRRLVSGLCMLGLIVNGPLAGLVINLRYASNLSNYRAALDVGFPSLFYLIVCLIALVAVWRARPSRAAMAAPAAGAATAPTGAAAPAAAARPANNAGPEASRIPILIIAGLLATSLAVTPTMFHATEYGAYSGRLLTGLAVAAINCAIAAGLVRFRQPSRWAPRLAAFGLLLNGLLPTISAVSPFDFGRPGSRFFGTVGLTSLLYAALCLAAFVALRYARPSLSPAKDQGADAGERLQA